MTKRQSRSSTHLNKRRLSQNQFQEALLDAASFVRLLFRGQENRIYHELKMKYVSRGVGKIISSHSFYVEGPDQSMSLWRDCLVEADNWTALSYADNLWSDQPEVSMWHQQAHVKLKGTLRRAFIYDEPEIDLVRLYYALEEQKKSLFMSNPTDLRVINKQQLLANLPEAVRKRVIDEGLIDVAIGHKQRHSPFLPEDYTLSFKVAMKNVHVPTRDGRVKKVKAPRVTGAILSSDPERLQIAQHITDTALKTGQIYDKNLELNTRGGVSKLRDLYYNFFNGDPNSNT